MKHEFRDELRIQVDHDHDIDVEVVDHVVDKIVEGSVIIIAVATGAHILRKWLT